MLGRFPLRLIIDGILRQRRAAQPCVGEQTLKAEIFIYLRPVNAVSAQHKIPSLPRSGIGKAAPPTERIACLPTVLGLCPNIGIIHPYPTYSILFHCLYHFCLKNSFHRSIITSSFSEIKDSIKAISCFPNPWLYTCSMGDTLYFVSFPSFNTWIWIGVWSLE